MRERIEKVDMLIWNQSLQKWNNLPTNAIINGNELSWTFQKYVRTTKTQEISDNLTYNSGDLTNNILINNDEVITYKRVFSSRGELTV